MYKESVALFMLVISMNSFSWEMIYVNFYGYSVPAWVPQSQLELDAAQQSNAQVIPFGNGQGVFGIAYIFPNDYSYPQSEGHHFQHIEQYPTIQPRGVVLHEGLLTHLLPVNPGDQVSDGGLLKFNTEIREQKKYCKDFAYNPSGCQQPSCKHVHIAKDDFKHRVICIRQITGQCRSRKCQHRHLLQNQLEQLRYFRRGGRFVPIIICSEEHKTEQEEKDCPYIHFSND